MPEDKGDFKITKENIDKVLEFMPYFENKDNIFFTVVDCWVEDSVEVINFFRTLYKENFTTSCGESIEGDHISYYLIEEFLCQKLISWTSGLYSKRC